MAGGNGHFRADFEQLAYTHRKEYAGWRCQFERRSKIEGNVFADEGLGLRMERLWNVMKKGLLAGDTLR